MNSTIQSDFKYPFEYGYLLLKDFDCGDMFVRKAQKVSENVIELKQHYELNVPISFIDINNKKNHSYIVCYGSKRKCSELMEEIKKNLEEMELNSTKNTRKRRTIKKEADSDDDEDSSWAEYFKESTKVKKPKKNCHQKQTKASISISPTCEQMDHIFKSIGAISQDLIGLREQQATLIEILREKSFAQISMEHENSLAFPKPDRLVLAELTAQFTEIIIKKRNSLEWQERIKSFSIPYVSYEQHRNIKELLIYGPCSIGSFIRSLAKELFGKERLATTLLGHNGKCTGVLTQYCRSQIFSIEEELRLIKILKLIDPEFFTSRDVYKFLVREKINQYGLDIKRRSSIKVEI